ncbi:DnaB-like helicase C-terminal domain-containing protein [Pyruvatibacter sp.]
MGLSHQPCFDQDGCGSTDAMQIFDDGWAQCHSCGQRFPPEGKSGPQGTQKPKVQTKADKKQAPLLTEGTYHRALSNRHLSEETVKKFGYKILDAVPDDKRYGRCAGKKVHVAPYYRGNVLVAQKLRTAMKDFAFCGDTKKPTLFGQQLWSKGKKLVVTEGEIDCMSVSQVQGHKWPTVSVPNGAGGAPNDLKHNLEYLNAYDEIILMFDGDDVGRAAAEKAAQALPPGKAYIAYLPDGEDPNSLLQAGKGKSIIDAIWQAKPYRPDGIVAGADLTLEDIQKANAEGYALPYERLQEKLRGLRKQELTLLTAGSGIGKSTLAREIAYHLHKFHGLTIGNVYLEESTTKTAQGYIAIDNDVSLGNLRANPSILSEEQWAASMEKVINERMYFYDHFGSLESTHLLDKLRFMAVGLGVDFIILDHISIVVSGQTASSEGERRDIDILMTRLRSLVEETGVGIIAIVHLKQPEGKAHEEGGRVTLSQLRGSGSLKQLSDNVIALERDQQDEDGEHLSTIRVLKNREFGFTGEAGEVQFIPDTGRLLPAEDGAPF